MTTQFNTPKITPLYSPRTNTPVKNQYRITMESPRGEKIEIFQSYKTIIARYDSGKLTLDTNAMNYSKTTSKYLYQFTNSSKAQLEERIKEGLVKVRNLNS